MGASARQSALEGGHEDRNGPAPAADGILGLLSGNVDAALPKAALAGVSAGSPDELKSAQLWGPGWSCVGCVCAVLCLACGSEILSFFAP